MRNEIGPAFAVSALLPVGLTTDLDAVAAERGISRAAALRLAAEQWVAGWQAKHARAVMQGTGTRDCAGSRQHLGAGREIDR